MTVGPRALLNKNPIAICSKTVSPWWFWGVASPESERGGVLMLWLFQYQENVSFSLRISVYPRVSHTFYTESFSQKHWGRKNVRKLLWHTRSKPLNFFNKRSLKKKPWMQGLSITTPARSPECSTQQTMKVYGQSAFHETTSHFS
jgi:hypothetical protein